MIPVKVRKAADVEVGDFLKAGYEKGTITLTPKSFLDRELADSLVDFRVGKTSGPFNTVEEMISYLKKEVKKIRASKAKRMLR